MSKNIVRTSKRENPFVMIDHRPLNDDNLSWQAKGLLAYLLSKPDNWTVIVADLVKRATNGRDSVNSILKELEQNGYVERIKIRDPETGRFSHQETIVYEVPQERLLQKASVKPETENPLLDKKRGENTKSQLETRNGFSVTGKPVSGKPDTNNIDLSNNDQNNNDLSPISEIAATSEEERETNSNELVERESSFDLKIEEESEDDFASIAMKAYQEQLKREKEKKAKRDYSVLLTKKLTADDLISFWNNQEVNPHYRLGDRTKQRIIDAWNEALTDFSAEDLFMAILNYADLFKSDRAKHKYRLVEFLERKGYEHFLNRDNWTSRNDLGKFTRDDFTYEDRGYNFSSLFGQETEMVRAEKVVEKPFDDVDSEVRRRVAKYEAQLRRVGFYSEHDIRDMVKEYQVLCRYRVNEEYARWERRSAELPND